MVSNADEDDEFSGSDSDEGFNEDMEALRRACILTGTDPQALDTSVATGGVAASSDSDEEDFELVRGIQQRLTACNHAEAPLFLKPLCTLPPAASDDDEDDFETLRAIQRRFEGYDKDSLKSSTENDLKKLEQVQATNVALEKETSTNVVVDRINVSQGFSDSLDVYNTSQNSESVNEIIPGIWPSGVIEWHQPDEHNLAMISPRDSSFPKSAQMFVDAIKKNRACQKFLRSKMIQIEARIEENKKLKQRVKILKDFQVTCKKRTGRALSQKKDARVQLISAKKPRTNSKVNGKKVSALYYGPDENCHVPIYRMVLTKFPISLSREKWSDEERTNLAKGIKQQLQELLFQKSVDLISDVEGSIEDSNDFGSIVASIRDLDITPANIRSYLPKVNWERLASMYVTGHSGAECESRWLNCEDPLINHHPWGKMEDKKLLHIVQERGINNWIEIAVLLGTNRTPFQCLARYQRSLNASILKREWTEDEDNKLRAAVEALGESNWQSVASTLEGRTGTQCSNRWIKSLHPARQKVGRWTKDEDKRLKVAVMLFGPKTWKKVAKFVLGRTHVQCRERWFNSLDPALNMGRWTEDEDSKLKAAISEHGYCWSKVASCVPPRTDNQCRRRWKVLLPHEVPLLQAARKIQKAALISNFVDRESERPALGPNDFIPLALTNTVSESENVNLAGKQKRKSRRRSGSKANSKVSRSKRPTKETEISYKEVLLLTDGNEVENFAGEGVISNKRVMKLRPRKKRSYEPNEDMIGNGLEVRQFDGVTKKRRSLGRRKRTFSGRPEVNEIDDSMKERTMEPCSKKNKGTDLTKAHLSAYEDSELLVMTNGEDVGECGGDAIAKNKKEIKPGRRKRKRAEPLDGISGIINSANIVKNKKPSSPHLQDECTDPTQDHSSSCPDSTPLMITIGNEVEAFGDDGERKNNTLKLGSRNSKYSRLLQELSEINDSIEVETLDGCDAIVKKKRVTKQSLKKCSDPNHSSSSESFTETDNEVEAFVGNDATKKRRASKPHSMSKCTDHIETSGVKNTTLHRKRRAKLQPNQSETTELVEVSERSSLSQKCSTYVLLDNDNSRASGVCTQERLKRSRTSESCSNHTLEAEDGDDDMTLACFIKNNVKRRRLKLAEKGNDVSSHLEDQPGTIAGEINCGKSRLVAGGTLAFHESLIEPLSIDVEGVFEAGDDDPSDTSSPPPGFENPIYGRSPS
ncbi:hypothetical protein CsSME_00054095 [Camellia sinensis var. sinensis]